MITDEQIKELIAEEETAIKYLEEEGIKTKDCMYEIGVFMKRANIDYLKSALEGKVDLTKKGIEKAIKFSETMHDDAENNVRYGMLSRTTLLKKIQERFYSEKKTRVSRKQRIAAATEAVNAAKTKLNAYKYPDYVTKYTTYTINGTFIACQKTDNVTGMFNGEWCKNGIRNCITKGCLNYVVFIEKKVEYMSLLDDLDRKRAELKELETFDVECKEKARESKKKRE